MSYGNGKRLVPGLESYLKGSDFYRDPRWKALVRQERDQIKASTYRERDRIAKERAAEKYFLTEEPG